MTYALVTVNHKGGVSVARGIPTRELAEQARCMALHGMSIEGLAAYKKRRSDNAAEYFRKNPGATCYGVMEYNTDPNKYAEIFIEDTAKPVPQNGIQFISQ